MNRRERAAVLAGVTRAAYDYGRRAGLDAGLDADTADAVGHSVAARIFDEQAVGPAVQRIVDEEIQRHANP